MSHQTKICKRCKIEKSVSEFGIEKKKYIRSTCNPCRVLENKEWRALNPDLPAFYSRKNYKKNKEKEQHQ